jgi:pilus assembly protein CpaF
MVDLLPLIAIIDEQIKSDNGFMTEDPKKEKYLRRIREHEQEMKLIAPKGSMEAREVTKNRISFILSEMGKDVNFDTINQIISQYHIDYFANIYSGGNQKALKTPIDEEIADYLQMFSITKHDSYETKFNKLVQIIYQELYGYSILDELIFDTTLNEVSCNRYDYITIQYKGVKRHIPNTKFKFKSNNIYEKIIRDRMLANAQKEINRGNSMNNCILLNGYRVTATQPPLSRYFTVTVRLHTYKTSVEEDQYDELMPTTIHEAIVLLATKGRRNVGIIGEMGSGKTTAADEIIIKNIDDNVAIGLAESTHELNLSKKYPNKNVIEFQYEGLFEPYEITAMMLRFNRDIITYGEIRTHFECFEAVKAMLRQARGSLFTFHSSTPERTIHDMRQLLMQTGYYTDYREAQFDVADAVDLLIQLRLDRDTGKRYVYKVAEVIASVKDMSFEVKELFKYDKEKKRYNVNSNGISNTMITSCLEYEMSQKDIERVNLLIKETGKEPVLCT